MRKTVTRVAGEISSYTRVSKMTAGHDVPRRFLTVTALLFLCFSVFSCGIYDIDEALKAPYNLSMTPEELKFYGDDEALLEGYNLWYKESEQDLYKRCERDGLLTSPTVVKTGEATSLYTIDINRLSPQDSSKSFYDINTTDNTEFYFAVSSYGTGMAESGKAAFGLWPSGAQ